MGSSNRSCNRELHSYEDIHQENGKILSKQSNITPQKTRKKLSQKVAEEGNNKD